jgi:hypothetical protein
MRVALLLAFLCFFATDANAHFCKGCGCKTGSGWRHNTTQKCIGCDPELSKRCGKPATEKCTFEGHAHISRIRINCPLK